MADNKKLHEAVAYFHEAVTAEVAADAQPDSDSDGLVQFYNLSASDVKQVADYDDCKRYLDCFSSLLRKVYVAKAKKMGVNNYDLSLWNELYNNIANFGFGPFKFQQVNYSYTQTSVEFNTSIMKVIFDSITIPGAVVDSLMNFMTGVGKTISAKWEKTTKSYKLCWVTACHEGIKDSTGKLIDYVPKLKFYYVELDATQRNLTTTCGSASSVTYNLVYQTAPMVFSYESLKADPVFKKIVDDTCAKVDQYFAKKSANYFEDEIDSGSTKTMYDNFDEAAERVALRIKEPLMLKNK